MDTKKQNYINACVDFLKEKIEGINSIMNETQSAANSDTKSSAGDKHETSRAMAHLENERLGRQLEVLNLQLETVYSIKPEIKNTKITLGSIVYCEEFIFFISTGLGKIKLNKETTFFAIATDSPIAKNLSTKKVGEKIIVGNKTQTITTIL